MSLVPSVRSYTLQWDFEKQSDAAADLEYLFLVKYLDKNGTENLYKVKIMNPLTLSAVHIDGTLSTPIEFTFRGPVFTTIISIGIETIRNDDAVLGPGSILLVFRTLTLLDWATSTLHAADPARLEYFATYSLWKLVKNDLQHVMISYSVTKEEFGLPPASLFYPGHLNQLQIKLTGQTNMAQYTVPVALDLWPNTLYADYPTKTVIHKLDIPAGFGELQAVSFSITAAEVDYWRFGIDCISPNQPGCLAQYIIDWANAGEAQERGEKLAAYLHLEIGNSVSNPVAPYLLTFPKFVLDNVKATYWHSANTQGYTTWASSSTPSTLSLNSTAVNFALQRAEDYTPGLTIG